MSKTAASPVTDFSDYQLGSGDLLDVTVFEAKDLSCTTRVSSRGSVTLPLLGHVAIKGLTVREAEEQIERLYADRYIKNPHVSLFVKERFNQRVTLAGKVRKPGTYDFVSTQRLLDALALAGGFTDEAGQTVQIRRQGSNGKDRQVFLINIEKMIDEGSTDLNIPIQGGDVIFVPEAGVFFIDGAVRKPGQYHIKEDMIITEAVMSAGGFAPWADQSRVTLIRQKPSGERDVLELDLESDAKGRTIKIRDHDVIIAKGSGFGKLVHGTGISFGIPGVVGIGYKSPEK